MIALADLMNSILRLMGRGDKSFLLPPPIWLVFSWTSSKTPAGLESTGKNSRSPILPPPGDNHQGPKGRSRAEEQEVGLGRHRETDFFVPWRHRGSDFHAALAFVAGILFSHYGKSPCLRCRFGAEIL